MDGLLPNQYKDFLVLLFSISRASQKYAKMSDEPSERWTRTHLLESLHCTVLLKVPWENLAPILQIMSELLQVSQQGKRKLLCSCISVHHRLTGQGNTHWGQNPYEIAFNSHILSVIQKLSISTQYGLTLSLWWVSCPPVLVPFLVYLHFNLVSSVLAQFQICYLGGVK